MRSPRPAPAPPPPRLKAAFAALTAKGASVVLRLCTADDAVVAEYHQLDVDPELALDLLDDTESEARGVAAIQGPWLTYGAPLQLAREIGCRNPLFDLLDERPLELVEVWKFCALLLFDRESELPHPQQDWAGNPPGCVGSAFSKQPAMVISLRPTPPFAGRLRGRAPL